MRFTRNIIFSQLCQYRGKIYVPAEDQRSYQWVALLPDDGESLRSDMVYVCRLSEALRHNQSSDCLFVCVYDRFLSEEEREDNTFLRNIIIIEENRSISWVLNLIQSRFRELEDWETQMRDVMIAGGGYQELFDVSENVLRNALFALDATYRMIACSKTYRSADPINIKLYELGYHAQETMEKFYKYNRIEDFQNREGLGIGKPGTVSEFETLSQWCRFDGAPLVQIVEVFSCEPMGADSKELFSTMMHYVNLIFLREQDKNQGPAHNYTRFLRDMINGELTDTQQISDCARKAAIPVSGFFDAYRIRFRDNGKVLVGRFADELAALLPGCRIVAWDFTVSVLNCFPKPDVDACSRAAQRVIAPLLKRYGALCGVSAPFTVLYDFAHACRQADRSLELGPKLPEGLLKKAGDCHSYENVFFCCLLEAGEARDFDPFYNNPWLKKLEQLRQYDDEHGGSLSEILYRYLLCERRATEAGESLHMHRNTVMYHIQRITDLLGLNLDDYLTRQSLLACFLYLMTRV